MVSIDGGVTAVGVVGGLRAIGVVFQRVHVELCGNRFVLAVDDGCVHFVVTGYVRGIAPDFGGEGMVALVESHQDLQGKPRSIGTVNLSMREEGVREFGRPQGMGAIRAQISGGCKSPM